VVVDGADRFARGAYALRVRAVPALPSGASCDPSGALDACRIPQICTSRTGTPLCAPGAPPSLGAAAAQVLENGLSVRILVSGGDPDGDAVLTHVDLRDAAGL